MAGIAGILCALLNGLPKGTAAAEPNKAHTFKLMLQNFSCLYAALNVSYHYFIISLYCIVLLLFYLRLLLVVLGHSPTVYEAGGVLKLVMY